MRCRVVWVLLCACNEFTVTEQEELPAAEPPGGTTDDDFGDAPDWNDCASGYLGNYYNLPSDHPDVEPEDDEGAVIEDPTLLDWWSEDRLVFERYDASLDLGAEWWPVDEGLADDPEYFSARWTAWIRVNEALPVELVLGGSTDVFVFVNDALVASQTHRDTLETEVVEVELPTGQFPLEVRSAHRFGDSGLQVRVASEHAVVCYPDFDD